MVRPWNKFPREVVDVSSQFWGIVEGQVGWHPEKPDLVSDIPVHGGEVETRWSLRSLPIYPYYDSVNMCLKITWKFRVHHEKGMQKMCTFWRYFHNNSYKSRVKKHEAKQWYSFVFPYIFQYHTASLWQRAGTVFKLLSLHDSSSSGRTWMRTDACKKCKERKCMQGKVSKCFCAHPGLVMC